MKKNADNKVFKSFEQMKNELLPLLVKQSLLDEEKQNIEQFAVSLADDSFDNIMNNRAQ
jgi:hypothetical protein